MLAICLSIPGDATMSLGVVAVLVILFLIAAYAVTLYNGLVRLKHGVGKAWANIDVLLRQRHEELPKLVETCRQYMQHERSTLEQVISARNAVSSAREQGDVGALGQAETGLRAGLGGYSRWPRTIRSSRPTRAFATCSSASVDWRAALPIGASFITKRSI